MTPIRIAAALIDNGEGQMLLVRKAGTQAFMQAGGKIEASERPVEALRRELKEELGWDGKALRAAYIGRFRAEAVHERGRIVEAELFHLRVRTPLAPAGEIEAAVWVDPRQARTLSLAPLTAEHVLPLFEEFLTAKSR